jgi:hypothetical protein
MRRVLLLLSFVGVLTPRAAWPQAGVPLGPEFRVNSYTTSNQLYPSVARASGGNFVVVWTSNTEDGSSLGVFGQRYSSGGAPLGPEFRVNTYTTGAQYLPHVVMDTAGDFLVVWQSNGQEGNQSIFGQIFLDTGAPFGGEFRVNTYTTNDQAFPSVASNGTGAFLVTWQSYLQDGSSWGVYGQRFGAGTPVGGEFRLNTYTTNGQFASSAGMDTTGQYAVVVWHSNGEDGSGLGIYGQRMSMAGNMLGSEFRVNTYTTNAQSYPAVDVNTFGRFVVVWQSAGQDGSQTGVYGQAFDFSGVPMASEFRVNTYTTSYQQLPDVATDNNGDFVVAWASYGPDGSNYGIFGQRYDPGGTPLGTEFRINTFTTNGQNRPAVDADSLGNFVVTWDSQLQDGAGLGVFGQRFGPILPVELMHYGVE